MRRWSLLLGLSLGPEQRPGEGFSGRLPQVPLHPGLCGHTPKANSDFRVDTPGLYSNPTSRSRSRRGRVLAAVHTGTRLVLPATCTQHLSLPRDAPAGKQEAGGIRRDPVGSPTSCWGHSGAAQERTHWMGRAQPGPRGLTHPRRTLTGTWSEVSSRASGSGFQVTALLGH